MTNSGPLAAEPGNRVVLDVPRRVADVVERDAQLAHSDIEPVVEVDDSLRPQRFDELFARDYLARPVGEFDEDTQGLLW